MDANGQRFWLLAAERQFLSREHAMWDRHCRVLKLASERTLPPPAAPATTLSGSIDALELVPRALDAHGSLARWVEEGGMPGTVGAILVTSPYLPDDIVLLRLAERPRDLAVGRDGVLYIALADGVMLHDLRGRWRAETVRLTGFSPWRLAAAPDEGVFALDRSTGAIARLTGRPLPLRPAAPYAHTTFRPCDENPDPPTLRFLAQTGVPANEQPIGLASDAEAGLIVLSWLGDGEARLRRLDPTTQRLSAPTILQGARYAYAVAWLDLDRIAIRLPGRRDAPAFTVEFAQEAPDVAHLQPPLGDIYPLAAGALDASFVHGLDGPPHYPTIDGAEPLHRLSLATLARRGSAANFAGSTAHLLDSGSQQTVWHRLNAEARIPTGAGFIVWLTATAEPLPPASTATWCAHRFGTDIAQPAGPHEPVASWEPLPSELPGHPGLGPWESQPGRSGLFTVLIQNPSTRVRTLVGRYLWVRVELFGDGRVTPEIAALRAWSNRFSYRDQYLPRIYRESLHGAPAVAPGQALQTIAATFVTTLDLGGTPPTALVQALAARDITLGATATIRVETPGSAWLIIDRGRTLRLRREEQKEDGQEKLVIALYRPRATPADFLDRHLASFEAFLTPLEDRVAAAHLLTDPASVPEANLDWLAAWIGIAFDPALPAARRREWLAAAPELARAHGTRRGLELALDIATGGGVRGGEIVLLEDFRLRRLLATLLGVDLADEKDPLLPGLTISGNSIVGDTLTLGEAATVELLALFRAEVADAAENAAVLAFHERLAHRSTVLVHQTVTPQDLGLIRRIVELEAPAHVEVRVLTATWPLLVGVASLVGVDTYLGPPRRAQPARLQRSAVGMGDYVLGLASLDPRRSGAAAPPASTPPSADAGPDFIAATEGSFMLDGSHSVPAPGRMIERYTWRRLT